jgi:hypothetical protein
MSLLRRFLFDEPAPAEIDLVAAQPDPDLAARNAARIAAVKKQMGDKWLLARPINAPITITMPPDLNLDDIKPRKVTLRRVT